MLCTQWTDPCFSVPCTAFRHVLTHTHVQSHTHTDTFPCAHTHTCLSGPSIGDSYRAHVPGRHSRRGRAQPSRPSEIWAASGTALFFPREISFPPCLTLHFSPRERPLSRQWDSAAWRAKQRPARSALRRAGQPPAPPPGLCASPQALLPRFPCGPSCASGSPLSLSGVFSSNCAVTARVLELGPRGDAGPGSGSHRQQQPGKQGKNEPPGALPGARVMTPTPGKEHHSPRRQQSCRARAQEGPGSSGSFTKANL